MPEDIKEVGLMARGLLFKYGCFFILLLVSFAGCGPKMTGVVKDDITLTKETERLVEEGLKYRGPAYNIAILSFENKTPMKRLNIGSTTAWILLTLLKQAGLEPIHMTEYAIREHERMMELQQSGVVQYGVSSVAKALEAPDYRISGAITSYSELEEGTNILISKTKTQVARVQVDYTLVNVSTGKVLLAESGTGEYRKKTGGLFGFGSKSTADAGLRDGALRDALTKAIHKMIKKLNKEEFVSNVLAVDGKTIFIRAGVKSRFDPGTVFSVYRPGAPLVDPETGRVIGRRQKLLAEVVITEHQSDRVSLVKVKSGAGIMAGDVIRLSK
jgi:curli biogenesis system outer membrane secretion channel CsgG